MANQQDIEQPKDFFVSYARADNRDGWITRFVEELVAAHGEFSGGRELTYFFDKRDIHSLDDWQLRIYDELAGSQLFVAFLSPSYFASEWCCREWRTWLDLEVSKHILSSGAAPVYFVEVPGFVGKVPGLSEQATLDEHEVARRVAELCKRPADELIAEAAPVVRQFRERRQIVCDFVQPFENRGIEALREADLREVLSRLAQDLDERSDLVKRARQSVSTVPTYNKRFTGRLDELLQLRDRLMDDGTGVVCGIHGLGGIGKTELAYAYAHAFAGVYPGGRFEIRCDGRHTLREAILTSERFTAMFGDQISDEERKQPEVYFAAILRCLQKRLDEHGRILLVLDNVIDPAVVSPEQTDPLTALGGNVHLLATTRLPEPPGEGWVTLGELSTDDALRMMEKYRAFGSDDERAAARQIVDRLGGFALAIELVAAGLAAKKADGATYRSIADDLGLDDLDMLAEQSDVKLRRHNHEKRLAAVLGPTLDALSPPERLTLDYAALLPPDLVPLPWLRELVVEHFPELAESSRWGDPWEKLVDRLVRLAIFVRVEEETTNRRMVRVHRLVQDLVREDWSEEDRESRQKEIVFLVIDRQLEFEDTTNWQSARWELEPLDALGKIWADIEHPQAAYLLNLIGHLWNNFARYSRAEMLIRWSLKITENKFEADDYRVHSVRFSLVEILMDTNQFTEAEQLVRRVIEIEERAGKTNQCYFGEPLVYLAKILQATGRLSEAESQLRRALNIAEQFHSSDVKEHLFHLALLLLDASRYSEAETAIRRALNIKDGDLGANHPFCVPDLDVLAQILMATNRFSEAEDVYKRALEVSEQAYGAYHSTVASCLNNLAEFYSEIRRFSEAEPLMCRALEIEEHNYGTDHPIIALRLNNLAQLLKNMDRHTEAELMMRQALEIHFKLILSNSTKHKDLEAILDNYKQLLEELDRSDKEIRQEIDAFLRKHGLSLD